MLLDGQKDKEVHCDTKNNFVFLIMAYDKQTFFLDFSDMF